MIQTVTFTNHKDESLEIDLRNPWPAGLAIMSMTGLGPPGANINMTELSTVDGSVFNSARVPKRNIVIQFAILDHDTIEEARHMIYRYFPIKKPVTVTIKTDTREVYTIGYVEMNEPEIFSNFETAQVSLVCADPYFYSVENTVTYLNAIAGGFEFPFTNPVNTNSLKFGELSSGDPTDIYYEGETPVGVEIEIHFSGAVRSIRLYNITSDQEILIDTDRVAAISGNSIQDGDIIKINTIAGHKSVILNRGGNIFNILSCLSRDTRWIQLEHGDNIFVYSAQAGVNNMLITVFNKELYEGV